jgi:hypothetical protein
MNGASTDIGVRYYCLQLAMLPVCVARSAVQLFIYIAHSACIHQQAIVLLWSQKTLDRSELHLTE